MFRSSAGKSMMSGKRVSIVLARKCSSVVFWSADLVELSCRGEREGEGEGRGRGRGRGVLFH